MYLSSRLCKYSSSLLFFLLFFIYIFFFFLSSLIFEYRDFFVHCMWAHRKDCGVFMMKLMETWVPYINSRSIFSYQDILNIRILYANKLYFFSQNEADLSLVTDFYSMVHFLTNTTLSHVTIFYFVLQFIIVLLLFFVLSFHRNDMIVFVAAKGL